MVLVGRCGSSEGANQDVMSRNGDASRGSGDRFSDERRSRGGHPVPRPKTGRQILGKTPKASFRESQTRPDPKTLQV